MGLPARPALGAATFGFAEVMAISGKSDTEKAGKNILQGI
jgi:hypothetical protein